MKKWILTGIVSFAAVGLGAYAKDAKTTTTAKNSYTYDAIVAKYDANKDGKLDDAEKAKMSKKAKAAFEKIMTKYDTNKDGVLDDTEKAAMKEDLKKGHTAKKDAPAAPVTPPAAPAAPVTPAT